MAPSDIFIYKFNVQGRKFQETTTLFPAHPPPKTLLCTDKSAVQTPQYSPTKNIPKYHSQCWGEFSSGWPTTELLAWGCSRQRPRLVPSWPVWYCLSTQVFQSFTLMERFQKSSSTPFFLNQRLTATIRSSSFQR